MWKALQLNILIIIFFAIFANDLVAQSKITIKDPESIKFVDEQVQFLINSSKPSFADLYWKNADSPWTKIHRLSPNETLLNWTIPYIKASEILLKVQTEEVFSLDLFIEKNKFYNSEIRSIVFSDDNRSIVIATDVEISVWNLASKLLEKSIDLSNLSRIRHATAYRNIDTIIISTISGVFLVDTQNETSHLINDPASGLVRMSKVHSELPLIAFGTSQGKLYVYNIETSKIEKEITLDIDNQSNSEVYAIAFSYDGNKIVCGTYNGFLYEVNLVNDEIVRFGGHGNESGQNTPIFEVAYFEDDSKIISCGVDQTVRIWDAIEYKELLISNEHQGHVRTADLLLEDEYFVSGSLDNFLIIQHIESDNQIDKIDFGEQVIYADISKDQRYIAAAGRQGTFRVWEIIPGSIFYDSISFKGGYRFDVALSDISSEVGKTANISARVSHKYVVDSLPALDYSAKLFASYPKEILTWEYEIIAGSLEWQINGALSEHIYYSPKLKLLQADRYFAMISVDSIITAEPDYYYFYGGNSNIEVIQECYGNSPRLIKIDSEEKLNIFINNKTLDIDVYLIADGHYSINVFNVQGIAISEIAARYLRHGEYSFNADISMLSAGVYYVSVISDGKVMKSKKFLVYN